MGTEATPPRRPLGLFRTSILSALATGARLVSGFVVNKFLAVYLGAAGIAVVGQLLNFLTIATTIGSGAIQNGVVKYTAEYAEDAENSDRLFSTSLRVSLATALLVSLGIAAAARPLAVRILGGAGYALVFWVLAGTLVCFVLQSLLLAYLNGRRDIHAFVFVQLFGSGISVAFAVVLPRLFGTMGALLSLATAQVLVFGATLFHFIRRPWFRWSLFARRLDPDILRRLSGFTLMALTSALVLPTAQMVIRSTLASKVSWDDAGQWQAVTRISDAYLMLLTTTLSVYYIPRLSAIKSDTELRSEVLLAFRTVLPAAAFLALLVFTFRLFIVRLLYTSTFLRAEGLFAWQLTGDVLKIAAWILGSVMQARAMTRTFIATEIFFGVTYAATTQGLIGAHGVVGAVEAFALNYLLYFLLLVIVFRRLLFWPAPPSSETPTALFPWNPRAERSPSALVRTTCSAPPPSCDRSPSCLVLALCARPPRRPPPSPSRHGGQGVNSATSAATTAAVRSSIRCRRARSSSGCTPPIRTTTCTTPTPRRSATSRPSGSSPPTPPPGTPGSLISAAVTAPS